MQFVIAQMHSTMATAEKPVMVVVVGVVIVGVVVVAVVVVAVSEVFNVCQGVLLSAATTGFGHFLFDMYDSYRFEIRDG